jgi:hypothetical protein
VPANAVGLLSAALSFNPRVAYGHGRAVEWLFTGRNFRARQAYSRDGCPRKVATPNTASSTPGEGNAVWIGAERIIDAGIIKLRRD